MARISLGEVPALYAHRYGADRWAIKYGQDILTWGELDCRSTRRAWALKALGIKQDAFVTLAVPSGTQFFELVFALWKIGVTPHVVSSRLPADELRAILDLLQPALVVASDPALIDAFGARPMDFGRDHDSEEPLPPAVAKRWKAMSSGGSTGRPKIILATEPSALDPAVAKMMHMPAEGCILTAGPLYHNVPMATSIWALLSGLQVVGMAKFEPEDALKLIADNRIAWTSLVPTMMMRMARLPVDVRMRYDLSSLETVWHSAAPMPAALKQEWIDWVGARKLWELYGGTEGIGTTMLNGEEWLSHRGSVGRPLYDKIRIQDDAGRELPAGEIGEIFALPNAGRGATYEYLGSKPRGTADGYETLGDFGWLDADGYLYIADRRTDMIVSGGANIFPAEVEGALMAHPGVEEAVVIGLPDDDMGAVAHAIIRPMSDWKDRLSQQDIVAFLRDKIVTYKIPRSFEWVESALRDDAGKVRRTHLRRERLKSNHPGSPGQNP